LQIAFALHHWLGGRPSKGCFIRNFSESSLFPLTDVSAKKMPRCARTADLVKLHRSVSMVGQSRQWAGSAASSTLRATLS